ASRAGRGRCPADGRWWSSWSSTCWPPAGPAPWRGWRLGSAAAGPVPGPDPDHEAQRRALEPKGPAQLPLQVAAVAGGELPAGEQDHLGRVDSGLGGVADLDRAAPDRRRWGALGRLPQPLVEGRRWDPPGARGSPLCDTSPNL